MASNVSLSDASEMSLTAQIFDFVERLFNNILQALNLSGKSGTIILLGLDNAGKTTLLHRLRTNSVLQFPPTDRPNKESFRTGGVTFVGWDLGGHEAVRHLWDDYVAQERGAVVFLIDAADVRRLDEVRDELDNLVSLLVKRNEDEDEDDENDRATRSSAPLAILLNKCDLADAAESRDVARAIDYDDIATRCGEENVGMFRISVWKGQGYQEAFKWISNFL